MPWCHRGLQQLGTTVSIWMTCVQATSFPGVESFLQELVSHPQLNSPSRLLITFLCRPQCWEEKNPPRDPTTNELRGDAKRFPDGMAALGAYVHALNLSFAMYTAESPTTCGGFPASANHEDLDAKTFAKCERETLYPSPFYILV